MGVSPDAGMQPPEKGAIGQQSSQPGRNLAPAKLHDGANAPKQAGSSDATKYGTDPHQSTELRAVVAAERAASAAEYADYIAGVGIIFSFIGVCLLVWTLLETRKSTNRQFKAYVFVDRASARLDAGKSAVLVSVAWKNSGQTPAINFRSGMNVFFANRGSSDDRSVDFSGPTSVSIVGPGGSHEILNFSVPVPDPQKWLDGSADLIVFAEAHYTDAFGCGRLTRNRFIIRGDEPGTVLSMRHSTWGNEAT